VIPELERLEMTAAAIEASLKYEAPEADENNNNITVNSTDTMLATK
jgi:hypothetical protein